MISAQTVAPLKTSLYDLKILYSGKALGIKMKIEGEGIRTNSYENIVDVLREEIPEVLDTICFNDLDLPFEQEVRNTEIGHLFEHILITLFSKNNDNKIYRGVTFWDWNLEPKGTFNIAIDIYGEDSERIYEVVEKGCEILNNVLLTKV